MQSLANQWRLFLEMLGSEDEANLGGIRQWLFSFFYLPLQDEFEEFGRQLGGDVQKAGGLTGQVFRGEVWVGHNQYKDSNWPVDKMA